LGCFLNIIYIFNIADMKKEEKKLIAYLKMHCPFFLPLYCPLFFEKMPFFAPYFFIAAGSSRGHSVLFFL